MRAGALNLVPTPLELDRIGGHRTPRWLQGRCIRLPDSV